MEVSYGAFLRRRVENTSLPLSRNLCKDGLSCASSPALSDSCFFKARFTGLLRAAPQRSSPQVAAVELAAKRSRFFAALQSRSATKRHCSQRNARCERDFMSEHHCGDSSTARLKPSGSFGSPPSSSFRFPVCSELPARIAVHHSICCSISHLLIDMF